ncbi:uncharacterized protein [Amphiura filiformis]|uniref:uncharacterized protein n=1 Tax=Amphiura filiformis TaxID=82378 RepID=UPI003B221A5B
MVDLSGTIIPFVGTNGLLPILISLISVRTGCGQLDSVNPVDLPCHLSIAYRCATGNQCIVSYFVCDSIVDCFDRSDEINCQRQHIEQCNTDFAGKFDRNNNPLAMFRCRSGQCVLGCKRCDRCLDCLDDSDEQDCTVNDLVDRPPCS